MLRTKNNICNKKDPVEVIQFYFSLQGSLKKDLLTKRINKNTKKKLIFKDKVKEPQWNRRALTEEKKKEKVTNPERKMSGK